jgi:hypothetical protein
LASARRDAEIGYSTGWNLTRRSSASTVMEQASPHSIAQRLPKADNSKTFNDFANMNLHRVRGS